MLRLGKRVLFLLWAGVFRQGGDGVCRWSWAVRVECDTVLTLEQAPKGKKTLSLFRTKVIKEPMASGGFPIPTRC